MNPDDIDREYTAFIEDQLQVNEQQIREDICASGSHDYGIIVACKRCGDAVHVCGVSGEPA